MPKTATAPPTDPRLWRRALAAVHPDKGGERDGELFIWLRSVRDVVEGAHALSEAGSLCPHCPSQSRREQPSSGGRGSDDDRIPFDPAIPHEDRVFFALRWYRSAPEPWRSTVMQLSDYPHATHGRREAKQRRGATWRQLAAIAHTAGMSRDDRREWYLVAESIGVSEAMASHVLTALKRRAAA